MQKNSGDLRDEDMLRDEVLKSSKTGFLGMELAFSAFYRGFTVGLNFFLLGKRYLDFRRARQLCVRRFQ